MLGALTSSKSNISLISGSPPTHPQLLLGVIWTWEEHEHALSSCDMLCVCVCCTYGSFVHGMRAAAALPGGEAPPGCGLRLSSDLHLSPELGRHAVIKGQHCRGNGSICMFYTVCILHFFSPPCFSEGLCWVRLQKLTCQQQLWAHVIFGEWGFISLWRDLWIFRSCIWIYLIFCSAHSCRNGNTSCSTIFKVTSSFLAFHTPDSGWLSFASALW